MLAQTHGNLHSDKPAGFVNLFQEINLHSMPPTYGAPFFKSGNSSGQRPWVHTGPNETPLGTSEPPRTRSTRTRDPNSGMDRPSSPLQPLGTVGGIGQMRSTIADMDPVKRGVLKICSLHRSCDPSQVSQGYVGSYIYEDDSYEWNHVRAFSMGRTYWYQWSHLGLDYHGTVPRASGL